MKFNREIESRHVIILLANIPAIEVKVTKVSEDELIATYVDGEEVHIATSHIAAWWYDKKSHAPRKKKTDAKKV
jgi:hypothetical protein